MTVFSFHANSVVSEHPEGECHFVGFADETWDTEIYLMLGRLFEDEEQDIQIGLNTFHMEWCTQSNSGYGGITQLVLKPSSANVHFDTKWQSYSAAWRAYPFLWDTGQWASSP